MTHVRSWYINGKHYAQTSEDWLRRQDANAKAGLAELEKDAVYKGLDKEEGRKAFYRYASYSSRVFRRCLYGARFRVFYLAVAEFFALHNGQE